MGRYSVLLIAPVRFPRSRTFTTNLFYTVRIGKTYKSADGKPVKDKQMSRFVFRAAVQHYNNDLIWNR